MKNVCLTCKELRAIATPSLYRRMQLFIGGQKDLRISAMLGRDNPGIPHIRKIYLEFEKTLVTKQQVLDDSSDEESVPVVEEFTIAARQAQFTVRLLLDFLPANILKVFRYCLISYHAFLMVCRHMRNQCLSERSFPKCTKPTG